MTELLSAEDLDTEKYSNDCDSDVNTQIKELNFEYREALADRPDILKYIERLHTIIRRQQKKLNKFYNKLKDHRFVKYDGRTNRAIQTDDGDHPQEPETDILSEGNISTSANNINGPWDSSKEGNSIADEVKEAAENAMKQTSFVYEPTSGMYYDYSTGYYYNAELRMYYDGNSGRYLIYNQETKQYHFQDGEEASFKQETSQKRMGKWKEKHKVKKTKECKSDEAEEGEITESSVTSSDTECSSDTEEVKVCEDLNETHSADAAFGCEPCIRIIVEHTTVDKLRPGSLFMITCKGGTMGREGDHAVLIPDINVSKHHAKFLFDQANSAYYIIDLGSRNGTWLDGERLSAALQESEAFELKHGAIIQVGGTKLLCHVHVGRDTCASCEPGLVQQVPEVTRENPVKNPEYKKQLQNLKKKFGVDTSQEVHNLPGYEDRAEIRRNTVGSSHHSEKTQSASVTEVIPQSNKGFKMLTRMGWSEGEKIGKTAHGLLEPISLVSNEGKMGLGSTAAPEPKISASVKKRQAILQKTKDRYRNISNEEGKT